MPVRGPRKPKPLGVPRGATVAAAIRAVSKGAAAPSRKSARPTSSQRPPPIPSYEEIREETGGPTGAWWEKVFDTPYDFTNPPRSARADGPGGEERRKRARRAEDVVSGAELAGGGGAEETPPEEEAAPEPWHFPDVEPTATSDPMRPRTEAAGYDAANGQLYVRFRAGADRQQPDGAIYRYAVPPAIADIYLNDLKTPSPGQFINHVLNHTPYERTTLPE